MDKATLISFRSWFADYVQSFHSNESRHQRNIDVKIEHTRRVCHEIIDIGQSLHLNAEDLRLAETIALFHDIGRFEQYKRYKTYSDSRSENHATLGIRILGDHDVLAKLDEKTASMILRTIALHNRIEIPEQEPEPIRFYCRLLRDADKLDIWRVVTEYYHNSKNEKNEALELDLPDTPEVSDKVLSDVLKERKVKSNDLKTLNDFKLMQMAWIYDVNFLRTFQLIRERRFMELIYNTMPSSNRIDRVYSQIRCYLNNKLAGYY